MQIIVQINDNKDKVKPIFEQITPKIESSFSLLQLNPTFFDAPYHFHSELELTWIRKGWGKRYIGGEVSDFEADDLVLVGANVPHCWTSENESENVQATVVQFKENFAGEALWELPELSDIKNMFEWAFSGILITGNARKEIVFKLDQFNTVERFQKFTLFIEILHIIAITDEIVMIDPQISTMRSSPTGTVRFQKVFSYLIQNFNQEISLKTIAGIANLTPTAFCRYFKSVTRKTLVEVITDFRLNKASQLLRTTDKPVTEVCFLSGFGNISYFNKTFKNEMGKTPLEYRQLLRNNTVF